MKSNKKTRETRIAELIREIALKVSDERAAKCGYDVLMQHRHGSRMVDKTIRAWEGWLRDRLAGVQGETQEERNGAWVPAIPL